MQEDMEQRSISLAISTSRLTAKTLLQAMKTYLNRIEQRHRQADSERRQVKLTRIYEKEKQKARYDAEGPHGRQTVKQIMRSGKEVRRLPVQQENLKEFLKVLRKYGVDFAITKGIFEGKSRYFVFFKAKDEKILSDVYNECIAKQLDKDNPTQKPSVLKALAQYKAITANTPIRVKQKELTR